jgi:hypothetical protein
VSFSRHGLSSGITSAITIYRCHFNTPFDAAVRYASKLPGPVGQQVAVSAADLTEALKLLHEINERLKVVEANTRAD